MLKIHPFLVLLFLMFISASGFADPIKSLRFSHHDWELACDNTGTCRAAGYHADEGSNKRLSVLLTRKAGKGTKVEGVLKLATYDQPETIDLMMSAATLSMSINGKNLAKVTKVKSDDELYSLSQRQTMSLIKALSGNSTILFQHGQHKWQLSDKGGAAVLLKMDEFQKRLGTRGALVKKGQAGESNVLKARPIPIIKRAVLLVESQHKAPLDKTQKTTILNVLKQSLSKEVDERDYCPMLRDPLKESHTKPELLTIHPLDKHFTLVSTLCWQAAYNEGYGFWLMDSGLNKVHRLITASGLDYSNGQIHEAHKGRGLADCLSHKSWVWNGKPLFWQKKTQQECVN